MMSANIWRLTFFHVLLIYAVVLDASPATLSPAISQSLSSRNTLRRNRHTEWVDLGGHEYKVVPVALIAQGHYSEAFNIVGGFQVNNTARRVPAILKRVSEVDLGNGYSKTREEIEFLKRKSVNLYLFSQWRHKDEDSYTIDIVVKDIGKVNPPFQPFYKWYLEDETVRAISGLRNARRNIYERLKWYAEEEDLLYEDFNVRNIFLRKRAVLDSDENDDAIKNVMPIDWGPPGRYVGVIDLAEIANKDTRLAMTKKFIDTLYSDLDKTFNVEELARELIRHGYTLRSEDFLPILFKGQYYELLQTRTGEIRTTYKVVELFQGKRALLDIVRIRSREAGLQQIRRSRDLEMKNILDYEMKHKEELRMFYEDTRP